MSAADVSAEPAQGATQGTGSLLPAFWPHRQASRFVVGAGLRWHVQIFEGQAQGPDHQFHQLQAPQEPREPRPARSDHPFRDLLLLHGAGASAHSWRDIAPALAQSLPQGSRVIVPDLPGHAFTARPGDEGLSLPGMARLVNELLDVLEARPVALIGHSAGAAVAARMALDAPAALRDVRTLISLNGAWLPPAGQGRWFYAPLARLFALNPWVPHVFAFHASHRGPLERLIASTGSRLDAAGIDLYAHLVSDRRHVAAVLAMMAAWDLRPLLEDLPRLAPALHLVVAEEDRTVPPKTSAEAARRQPRALLHRLPGLGHLAHEEAPDVVLELLKRLLV
jgi:magnesium chelatase accessory protein